MVHVGDHYSELRFLYTGCSVFRPVSDGRHANPTKDMCLCMDRADWFFRYEKLIPFSALYATLIHDSYLLIKRSRYVYI